MMLSQCSATTPRSCVMMTTAALNSRLQPVDQVQDLRLHRDVERRRRLVGDQHVGVQRERHRDHRPLAHAAGELVRVLAGAILRAGGCPPARASRPPGRTPPSWRCPGARGSLRRSGRRPCRTGAATSSGPGRSSRSSLPRMRAHLVLRHLERSWPWKKTSPVMFALGGDEAHDREELTLLPEPDSPTMPSVSPASKE